MANNLPAKDKLNELDVKVLRVIKREGEAHMEYYHRTMKAFKFPHLRHKAFDTVYYESVLPIVTDLLKAPENSYKKLFPDLLV